LSVPPNPYSISDHFLLILEVPPFSSPPLPEPFFFAKYPLFPGGGTFLSFLHYRTNHQLIFLDSPVPFFCQIFFSLTSSGGFPFPPFGQGSSSLFWASFSRTTFTKTSFSFPPCFTSPDWQIFVFFLNFFFLQTPKCLFLGSHGVCLCFVFKSDNRSFFPLPSQTFPPLVLK